MKFLNLVLISSFLALNSCATWLPEALQFGQEIEQIEEANVAAMKQINQKAP